MVKLPTSVMVLLLLGGSVAAVAAAALQDPLRPAGRSGAASRQADREQIQEEPVWRLTAVLLSSDRLVAILNGQMVGVGDEVEGYRVKAIERDRVVLSKQKRTIVVPRVGTGLKKPVTPVGGPGKEGSQ